MFKQQLFFRCFQICFVLILVAGPSWKGQTTPGNIDTSFIPDDLGAFSQGANNNILAIAKQSDGKFIIGGTFTQFSGENRNRIARITADGRLDSTFDYDNGISEAGTTVRTILIQPDGKILLAGAFRRYNDAVTNGIVRLNADGTLDETFVPGTDGIGIAGTSTATYINAVALQPDGKILIGGVFNTFDGVTKYKIARLNPNGSLDTTFTATGTTDAATQSVLAIALQSDGKILVGGNFTSFNGIEINRIARLNTDGSLDTTFTAGTGFGTTVNKIVVLEDDSILVGGGFTTYNNENANRLVKLSKDGVLNSAFVFNATGRNTGGTNYTAFDVKSIKMLPNNKLLVGGNFGEYNGRLQIQIVRISSTDGSLDEQLKIPIGTGDPNSSSNGVVDLEFNANNEIVAVGYFSSFDNTRRGKIVQINPENGQLDYTFNAETAINGVVYATARQEGGKILVGGSFNRVNTISINNFVRLNKDGSIDETFSAAPKDINGVLTVIKTQSDGKILIGGDFTAYNGVERKGIARLNTDGSLDETFNIGTGTWMTNNTPYGKVSDFAIQADGKIVVGGLFNAFNGVQTKGIVRLNADGSIDTSFNPGGIGIYTTEYSQYSHSLSLAISPTGKILFGVSGGRTTYNGTTINGFAQLNADGTIDEAFFANIAGGAFYKLQGTNSDPGAGMILDVDYTSEGKIILAGLFTMMGTVESQSLARLNADGTLDTTFSSGVGVGNLLPIISMALQKDDKIVMGGNFTSYNSNSAKKLARVNTDGSFDTTFDVGAGLTGSGYYSPAYSITLLPESKIIIGGDIITYRGQGKNGIVRVYGSECNIKVNTEKQNYEICSNTATTLTASAESDFTINWYAGKDDTNSLFTGNSFQTPQLAETTSYWVESQSEICRSERVEIVVTVSKSDTPQAVAVYEGQVGETLADLANQVTASGILTWYADEALTTVLPETTLLGHNVTYYVTQTINGCISKAASIKVNIQALGVSNQDNDSFQYYPSPITDKLYFTGKNKVVSVQIFDQSGKMILNQYGADIKILDVIHLIKGVYVVKAKVGDQIQTFKILKK